MQLHAEIIGQGPPLLIFHGLFGSGTNWRTLAKHTLSQQYEVHLIDQRNHGDSPHHDVFNYNVLGQDIANYIEANYIEYPIAMGHSMGGKALMHAAVMKPELFAKLIIVDISVRAYQGNLRPIIEALENLELNVPSRAALDSGLSKSLESPTLRAFLLKNVRRCPTGGFEWRVNLRAISKSYEHMNAALSGQNVFAGPTLFIAAEKSDYVQDEDLNLIREYFPQATIEKVKGAGHWVHYEAPKKFQQVVERFLAAH